MSLPEKTVEVTYSGICMPNTWKMKCFLCSPFW